MLHDGPFETLTENEFQKVVQPKNMTLKHLDTVTRKKCGATLKHFVAFSSMASGRGNSGQTNYALANSCMEQICEQRRNDGFPGISLQILMF